MMNTNNPIITKIVGVTFRNDDGTDRQGIIRKMISNGELQAGVELLLVPQPSNPYDHNCIQVTSRNGRVLGNLSKEVAAELAPQIERGKRYEAKVDSIVGGGTSCAYGVNIRIEEKNRLRTRRSILYKDNPKVQEKNKYTNKKEDEQLNEVIKQYNNKNYNLAFPVLEKLATNGNHVAEHYLAMCYDYGNGVHINKYTATKWYKKSAEGGFADAQTNLGYNLVYGEGTDIDEKAGLSWLMKAIEQGETDAMVILGQLYEHGIAVERDEKKAFLWYKRAADLDNSNGLNNVAIFYLHGKGITRDPYQAAKYNERAALKGHAKAQYNLGLMYWNGEGVKKNLDEAYKWLSLAQSNGHPAAGMQIEMLLMEQRMSYRTR